jgi:hypothetical protein
MRRFPLPWTVEKIPGGFKVIDANGQSLAYVYSRENASDAHMAKVLTEDEARRNRGQHRQASSIAEQHRKMKRAPTEADALYLPRLVASNRDDGSCGVSGVPRPYSCASPYF